MTLPFLQQTLQTDYDVAILKHIEKDCKNFQESQKTISMALSIRCQFLYNFEWLP